MSHFCQKILQSVVAQAKKLGKSVYLFSVDPTGEKVVHVNFVSEAARKRGLEARSWASKVSEVIGGKVCLVSFRHVIISNSHQLSRREGRKKVLRAWGLMSMQFKKP